MIPLFDIWDEMLRFPRSVLSSGAAVKRIQKFSVLREDGTLYLWGKNPNYMPGKCLSNPFLPVIGETNGFLDLSIGSHKKAIQAENDSITLSEKETKSLSILENDRLDNQPVNLNMLVTTLLDTAALTGVTLNDTGHIVIPAGNQPGKYRMEYKICDKDETSVCDTAYIDVTITAVEPEQPKNPTPPRGGGGSGGGGYIPPSPEEPNLPVMTSAPVCTAAIKNIDDPRLVAYYEELGVIHATNPDRKLTRAEFIKLIINA